MQRPLSKADKEAISAFRSGASRTDAYLAARPIAAKWGVELLTKKANEFFDSIETCLIDDESDKAKDAQVVRSKTACLTKKQERFCLEYLVDLNGKQAAIRAGYSERTAEQQASRLLSNVKVDEAIQNAMGERARRTKVSVDDVLHELSELAFAKLEEGIIKPSDKIRSLELLGKHLKMFTEKVEHSARGEQSIEIVTKDMSPEEASRIYQASVQRP